MNEPTDPPDLSIEHSFMNQFQMALINEESAWKYPLPPMFPNSTILGKADQSLIRLLALMKKTHDETNRLFSLIENQDSPEARRKSTARFFAARTRFQAIFAILNIETGRRFPQLWEMEGSLMIYLCAGQNIALMPVGPDNAWILAHGDLMPPPS
jgi:hypothetical protein